MSKFPFYKQLNEMDCGPACVKMISKFYGKHYTLQTLRKQMFVDREGVSLLGILHCAEQLGFKAEAGRTLIDEIKNINSPIIVHWKKRHFIIVYKIKNETVYIADPAVGKYTLPINKFKAGWYDNDINKGTLLVLSPTDKFLNKTDEKNKESEYLFLFKYLKNHRKTVLIILVTLFLGSLIQFFIPFFSQALVDKGIHNNSINLVLVILLGQLGLFIGYYIAEIIRNWNLLKLGTYVNIQLINDFLFKLLRLPLKFFDSKTTGDLVHRINDHFRVEQFLTSSASEAIFAVVYLIIFSFVLLYYNITFFIISIIGSLLYFLWTLIFINKRRIIEYRKILNSSENQNKLLEIITGISDIKLNDGSAKKLSEWKMHQNKLFKLNLQSVKLGQYQFGLGSMINQSKNILISFLSAILVIKGELTIGAMLAIQFIIGQLNSPIEQLVSFVESVQYLKYSLERISEIHNTPEEKTLCNEIKQINGYTIKINNLSFQYEGLKPSMILKNINISIPENKLTAIVGFSGSGKTTLLKNILGLYSPTSGELYFGDTRHDEINFNDLHTKSGIVLQDGFIFSDSILNNIVMNEKKIDTMMLQEAINIANLNELVSKLPGNVQTKIGQNGVGLSQGQKQRVLIARAVYKNPKYFFFDEATSALDAKNEHDIINKLTNFFKGRTVLVIAHRLSTVKNADQILVMNEGEIIEQGTHKELLNKRGQYFDLVKNQIELDKEV